MTDDTTTFTDDEAEAALTPTKLADMAASAAELAEAAAEHATTAAVAVRHHLAATYAYAARAEDAKERAAAFAAADEASAADAEAGRARLALADATVHVGFAEQHHRAIAELDPEGDHTDALAAAAEAVTRAKLAQDAAAAASDDAQRTAARAGAGVDWLRYHLDNRCRHWRDRVEPPTDEELQAVSGLGPVLPRPPF